MLSKGPAIGAALSKQSISLQDLSVSKSPVTIYGARDWSVPRFRIIKEPADIFSSVELSDRFVGLV